MKKLFIDALRSYIIKTGKFKSLYKRFCCRDSLDWALFLAKWGGFHSVGEGVRINVGCVVTDPAYVKIGSNVTLSSCTLIGHDGVVSVLNSRFGKKLDSVGMIEINDNSFVGHGAIVMPRVGIGPDSVVAAGAVVTKDVPPGCVVGGNPAKVICLTTELVSRIENRCRSYPWIDLIESRDGPFDPEIERLLVRMRSEHFFGTKK